MCRACNLHLAQAWSVTVCWKDVCEGVSLWGGVRVRADKTLSATRPNLFPSWSAASLVERQLTWPLVGRAPFCYVWARLQQTIHMRTRLLPDRIPGRHPTTDVDGRIVTSCWICSAPATLGFKRETGTTVWWPHWPSSRQWHMFKQDIPCMTSWYKRWVKQCSVN